MAGEEFHGVGGEAADHLARVAGCLFAEELGQADDILAAEGEGRQLQADVVDPLQEVAAKLTLLDEGGEVLPGGEDEPDVDGDGRGRAKRLDLTVAEDLEEPGLKRPGERGNLVQQDRAAVGPGEAARPFRRRIFLEFLAKQLRAPGPVRRSPRTRSR